MALFDSFKKKEKGEKDSLATERKESFPASNKKKPSSNHKKVSPKTKEAALTPGTVRIDQGGKGGEHYAYIIKKPRITEKSSLAAGARAYTFEVHPDATKLMVKRAMKEIYNIDPIKVNMIVGKPKKLLIRGRRGMRSGLKKAIVYLKKGDKIEFV